MRLIDADAFERDLTEHILPILIQRYGEEEAIRGLHFSYSDCISNISGQPTIEPERKTGKWVHLGGDEWCCDKCGFVITTEGSWEHPHDIGEKYCQNCGTKMEG